MSESEANKYQKLRTETQIGSEEDITQLEPTFDMSVDQNSGHTSSGFPSESRDIDCDWNEGNHSYDQLTDRLRDKRNSINQNVFIDNSIKSEKLEPKIEKAFDANQMLERMRTFSKSYFTEIDKSKKEKMNKSFHKYLSPLISKLCQELNSLHLNKSPVIEMLSSPTFVFGDIHGNFRDIYDYEVMFWKSGKPATEGSNYVFLGDFVDRGPQSVEVSVYLFLLKLIQPKKFFLIRGNHEIRDINKSYTFLKECKTKFGRKIGAQVWDSINTSFERLPLAAIVDDGVFCCHGGVPKSMTKLDDIRKIPKPLVDSHTCPAAHQLLWNDPIESKVSYTERMKEFYKKREIRFVANRARSTGYYFTELAVEEFFKENDLIFMIRAHECIDEGYELHFGGKVITVFSSSNYDGLNNQTACMKIDEREIRPVILKSVSQTSGQSEEHSSDRNRKLKRPPNADKSFSNENRERVAAKHPKLKHKDIMRWLGFMWTEMSDEERKQYKEKAMKNWEKQKEIQGQRVDQSKEHSSDDSVIPSETQTSGQSVIEFGEQVSDESVEQLKDKE